VTGIIVYSGLSLVRHSFYLSSAFDLGIFDQAVFLISIGERPVSSFLGHHILGDHSSLILYPLAAAYWAWASPAVLLLVQAIALGGAALPVWALARRQGHDPGEARLFAVAYLLNPIPFNANLFDFHPEALAVPMLLCAVAAIHSRRWPCFGLALAGTLACKAVLGLTVAALGLWLFLQRRLRSHGAMALTVGLSWFALSSGWLIPRFSDRPPAALARYSHLGDTVGAVALSPITRPREVAASILSREGFVYLAECTAALVWAFPSASLSPLIGAAPTFLLNVLSSDSHQRSLRYQYALPLLPFLFLAAIGRAPRRRKLFQSKRCILTWIALAFVAQTHLPDLLEGVVRSSQTVREVRAAVAMVKGGDAVLTSSAVAPHLSHRCVIEMTDASQALPDVTRFRFILLSLHDPSWRGTRSNTIAIVRRLRSDQRFELRYFRNGVCLFERILPSVQPAGGQP